MKLYIIGNGFDMYHDLNTSYKSFGLFLKKKYSDVYDLLVEHYGFTDLAHFGKERLQDLLWSEFETNLSQLNVETVLEAHADSIAVPGSPDFRDRDWHTFEIEMEMILEKLTVELYKAFKEFILSVKFPTHEPSRLINLDRNALYLNFNYTNTLQHYYDIPTGNILYIHRKAEIDGPDLILGHGIDPKEFEEKPEQPPEDLSDEDYERWMDYMSGKYDLSFELGKQKIMQYFNETFKGTDRIIIDNSKFFNKLSDIDDVIIIGHSLSPVDLPYIKEVKKFINQNSRWTVTYHSEEDKNNHLNTLEGLGIKDFSIVTISEIY